MKSKIIFNRKSLKSFRSSLRNRSTSAETALWEMLKSRKLKGRKFRRQYSIGSYIVDFCCPSEKLIIELDGAPHGESTTPAATSLCNTLVIIVLRPPLLQKEGKIL